MFVRLMFALDASKQTGWQKLNEQKDRLTGGDFCGRAP